MMAERTEELNSILVELLYGLGLSNVRIMLTMAVIKAYRCQYEIMEWFVDYYEREGTMPPHLYVKTTRTNRRGCVDHE